MIICILIGLLPFAVGGWYNSYILTCTDIPPYWLVNIVTLCFWFVVAFVARFFIKSTKKIVISQNLVAFTVLLLIAVQELILKRYWLNAVGSWTQFYYLPIIKLGFALSTWSSSMFVSYLIAFLSLVGVSILGCKANEKGRALI